MTPEQINNAEIIRDTTTTPFGQRPSVYSDHAASSRPLNFIEDYISNTVLPVYGNTHTKTSQNGQQTSDFVEEARLIIRNALRLSKDDRVLFCGSGTTAAVNQLVSMLGPALADAVIFVGPYEHHSNLIPWRESGAKIVTIPENKITAGPDLQVLEHHLKSTPTSTLKIGAFNATSNVTGAFTSTAPLTSLLHSHSALSFFDYAAASPSAHELKMSEKDALYFSPHKIPGGPQSTGILIVKKHIVRWRGKDASRERKGRGQTSTPGGGTVFYVTPEKHMYLKCDEEREQGGTPNIIGAIRAGLAIQLHQKIGYDTIRKLDTEIVENFISSLAHHPNLIIHGHKTRAPNFSLSFPQKETQTHLMLHHNFAAALLADLFGIQARSGCMCAGPYSQALLGISPSLADTILEHLSAKDDTELLRPGYLRISLSYYTPPSTVDYIVKAVSFISTHGYKLLPQYTCDAATGDWHHINDKKEKQRKWLTGIDYNKVNNSNASLPIPLPEQFASALSEARALVEVAEREMSRNTPVAAAEILPPGAAGLRWFLLPSEAATIMRGGNITKASPFTPPVPEFQKTSISPPPTPTLTPPPTHSTPSTPLTAWATPPKQLLNKVTKAVLQHGMLRPGDKVMLGLSGGKDSLALLHTLKSLQQRTPFKWDLAACTVDPQASGFDPSPLKPYLASLGIPYFYETAPIMNMAESSMNKGANRNSICSYCSRMKRIVLYGTMRRESYNVLAMAQHLDDQAESFVMSALHNGALRAMKAHYIVDAGDLRVIRPLVYVREKEAEAFAEERRLPIVTENCPACFEAPKERFRVKSLLAVQEALFPDLYKTLLKTLAPLMEPQVEDFLRLRRECYGKASGETVIPPPLALQTPEIPPVILGKKKRNAFKTWSDSLKLGASISGGRGCSLEGTVKVSSSSLGELREWFGVSLSEEEVTRRLGGEKGAVEVDEVEVEEKKEKEVVNIVVDFIGDVLSFLKHVSVGLHVVWFSAPWCKPCNSMSGLVDKLATEVSVLKVNVDENVAVGDFTKVVALPSFSIYIDGKLTKSFGGLAKSDFGSLVEAVAEYKN
ncbi:hypothetical protein TrLO_g12376 [Triparma laevis f. longispina]|uniref:Uncharacterized protein n=1 Tax=Triparma laevis f. longispina TaxID=1714387 RepID=A0A9W7FBM6_9STRA|nr:hypothetical protein TrLO_g12376 [Triparma laevis f. longispina]